MGLLGTILSERILHSREISGIGVEKISSLVNSAFYGITLIEYGG